MGHEEMQKAAVIACGLKSATEAALNWSGLVTNPDHGGYSISF